jgi:hypothetical protein
MRRSGFVRAVGDHVVDDALGHVGGAGDVDGEHPQVVFEGGVGEAAAGRDADVENRYFDRPAECFDEAPERLDAVWVLASAWWLQASPPSSRSLLRLSWTRSLEPEIATS